LSIYADEDTHSGVKYVMFGLAAIGLSEFVSAMTLGSMATAIRQEQIGEGSLCLACFGLLFSLAGIIVLVFGAYKLYKGSSIISSSHRTKVKIGGVLLIISVIFGRIWSAITNLGEIEDIAADVRPLAVSAGIAGTISSIIFVSALLLLIYEITEERHRNYMYGLFGIYVMVNLIFVYWYSTIPTTGEESEIVATLLDRVAVSQALAGLFSLAFAGIFYLALGNFTDRRSSDPTSGFTDVTEKFRECPECGEEKMKVSLDGSGFCEGCGIAVRSYYEEFEKKKDKTEPDTEVVEKKLNESSEDIPK